MKILLSLFILAFFIFLVGCSESTNSGNNAIVNIRSEMTTGTVSMADLNNKENSIQKSEVDSIRIHRVRILLSRIKFHLNAEKSDSIDKDFKTGPFLFVGDSTGTYFDLDNGQIPAGLYDKIKFEIHRFSSSDLAQYTNDAKFSEFATGDRYSVIIEGIAFKDGTGYSFVYNGTPTVNLSLKFYPSIEFQENVTTNLYLQVNPIDLLKSGTSVLDPRDPSNENDIDNLIKAAIKAVKKL